MSWDQTELKKFNKSNTSESCNYLDSHSKPIEMYVFIDPLCPNCWYFEPYIKKFSLEYGRFFTIQQILSPSINRDQLSCRKSSYSSNNFTVSNPWIVSFAIKAAEIQGKRAGKTFLRKLQEHLFLRNLDISNEQILMEIAREAKLDLEEFVEDMHSATARKAFQSDVQLRHEMEIDITPTVVFFNHSNDDQGIKIVGLYPYEVYEFILQETLQITPIPSEKPPLEEFLKRHNMVRSKEISIVYDWSLSKTEKELKKLQFRQRVNRVNENERCYWKYKE
ncbi:ClpXP adapter SpxH family protein [Oceanobacillus sp. FSL K6-0118]|uniref:ClpXP adapter SpxH family protein n=1 Tax=Oceanobacillus sp. FSL K6-0118 TaxID=2921418 RepID=UPI0030FBFFE7